MLYNSLTLTISAIWFHQHLLCGCCRLLGYSDVQSLCIPTFRKKVSPPSKIRKGRNQSATGGNIHKYRCENLNSYICCVRDGSETLTQDFETFPLYTQHRRNAGLIKITFVQWKATLCTPLLRFETGNYLIFTDINVKLSP
jgi:hypothetical protein